MIVHLGLIWGPRLMETPYLYLPYMADKTTSLLRCAVEAPIPYEMLCPSLAWPLLLSEGPSTQYLRFLVPKTILLMVFGPRVLKDWVLGPSEILIRSEVQPRGSPRPGPRPRGAPRRFKLPDLGVSENQGHLIWTQNKRILHARIQNRKPNS